VVRYKVHDAGPTLAGIAADMRASEAQVVAQELNEKGARRNIGRDRLAIDEQSDGGHQVVVQRK
jgi:hypothetical protein